MQPVSLPLTPINRLGCDRQARGFTLIELLLAVGIIGLLAALAVPSYSSYRDRINNELAIADIVTIEQSIDGFWMFNHRFPDSLAVVGQQDLRDPWGNVYTYELLSKPKATPRMDKNLNPINSDYDLYSNGKDGKSQRQLTANYARDDIVRAANGRFVGLAAEH